MLKPSDISLEDAARIVDANRGTLQLDMDEVARIERESEAIRRRLREHRAPVRLIRSELRRDDHRECRTCGYPLDVGDRVWTIELDDGPFCSERCAREHARERFEEPIEAVR